MRIRLRYGQAVLEGEGDWKFRPARVVDDVLGVLRENDERYVRGWMARYTPFFVGSTSADNIVAAGALGAALHRLVSGLEALPELAQLLKRAVDVGAKGRLDPDLAPLLADVRRLPGGAVEIPGFAPFVAWCIEELLRRGPLNVQTCPNCGLPWLGERGAIYCSRPAPGTLVKCRQLHAHREFMAQQRDFHRQRRRLYDRMKRGTLPESDYHAWLEVNRPGEFGKTWIKFEDWKAGKRPAARARQRKRGEKHG